MSEDLCRSQFTGRLVKDAELKYTSAGAAVLEFSLAVNRRRKQKQGEGWEEYGQFFDFSIFGRKAETLAQYMTKGSKIAVDAAPRQDRWEQDGIKRSKVRFDAFSVYFLGGRRDDAEQRGNPPSSSRPFPSGASSGGSDRFEDDIPF